MPTQYSQILANKRVLVLGGSSGIGYGVAEHALSQGAIVSIASSKQSKVDDAVAQLRASIPDTKGSITGYVCDLSDATTIKTNLESLLKSVTSEGLLDHIAHTSGDPPQLKDLSEYEMPDLLKFGTVRFFASLLLGGLAKKYMNSDKASSITLTSGARVKKPIKTFSPMTSYGAGLNGMALGLAVELAPIRVNTVSPGFVLTPMVGARFSESEIAGLKENYKKRNLTKSVGTPEELSEAYVYLMRCTFATGSVVDVDGGYELA